VTPDTEGTGEGPLSPPPLRLGRRLLGIGAGLTALGLFHVLTRFPQQAENLVGDGPLPALMRSLSRLTGAVPISLMEVVVLAVLARQGVGVVRGFFQFRRGEDTLPRTLARGGLRLAQDVGVLIFLFYLLWGFQYARPELGTRLGFSDSGTVSAAELRALAWESVHGGNVLYRALHGVDDLGDPTPSASPRELLAALEEGWERAADRWGLDPRLARQHGPPKPFLASPLVKRFGVAGMYFPFTGEALVLSDLPGALRGKEMAHEMAHQRGMARESDANALAYLVAREAPDPRIRYAAGLFIQRQLISALARVDPDAAWAVIQERIPGVRRDLEAVAEYWARARGPVSEATTRLNHAMLRTHGIAEGVESYQGSVWVFVALARREGVGSLLPEPIDGWGGGEAVPRSGMVP
jgi:hypothetical protein